MSQILQSMHGFVYHVKDFGLLISEYNALKGLIQDLAGLDLCFRMFPVLLGIKWISRE